MTDLSAALECLERGGIVGLPTDTVYGIGADPFQREAVGALFTAKGRPGVVPIPILAADLDGLERIAEVDDRIEAAAARYWPGALTIVARRAAGAPSWVGSADRATVGIRVPDHPLALDLMSAFGPVAVTSANRSGAEPAVDDTGARASLGDAVDVYLPGMSGGGHPSTVIDMTGPSIRVLRSGPVDFELGRGP